MKKVILIVICLLLIPTFGESLKGGVTEEYIPKGFFGSWGVISKLKSSNNPNVFNYESRDIWTLSGYDNILILENLESGAYSEITIKDKNKDNKTLKFERQKQAKQQGKKVIYKEMIEFVLNGKNFSGTDKFTVERYNENNELAKTDTAIYQIEGVRISGE